MDFNIRNVLLYLPDIAVALCFFPTGIHSGLMLFGQHFLQNPDYPYLPRFDFQDALWTSISTAAITAALLYLIKWRYKGREHFHHFKFLICGMCFLIWNGVAIFLNQHRDFYALYIGAVGQGIIYISGFSYINIRMKRRRSLKFAPSIFLYFIGMSLTLELIRDKLTIGLILSVLSSVILMLLLVITTSKQFGKESSTRSLDEDINSGFYTHNRNQLIEYLQTKHVLGKDLYIGKVDYTGAEVYMLFLKVPCAILFHAIFLSKTTNNQYMNKMDITILQWAACAGLAVGIILLFVVSTRTLLILCLLLSPLLLALTTYYVIVYSAPNYYYNAHRYIGFAPYSCYVALLGAAYIPCEMAILDTAPIKSSPIYLAIGFTIEKFITLCSQFYLYGSFQGRLSLLPAVVVSGSMLVVALFLVLFKMPNTYGKSLIEIKINIFWGIRYGYANNQITSDAADIQAGQTVPANTSHIAQISQVSPVTTPLTHVASLPQLAQQSMDGRTRSPPNDG